MVDLRNNLAQDKALDDRVDERMSVEDMFFFYPLYKDEQNDQNQRRACRLLEMYGRFFDFKVKLIKEMHNINLLLADDIYNPMYIVALEHFVSRTEKYYRLKQIQATRNKEWVVSSDLKLFNTNEDVADYANYLLMNIDAPLSLTKKVYKSMFDVSKKDILPELF